MARAMTTRTYRGRVTIRPNAVDLPGFLDMLRYDGCTVATWGSGDGRYVVTLESPRRFTVDRWASFGLRLEELEA